MSVWTGFLHSSGSPALRVAISGIFQNVQREFDAIIDTGFTGFVSMPMLDAFPLGLVLNGTTSVTLADGSTAPKLTALGTVTIAGESRTGVIILESQSKDVLLGMELINFFGKSLQVCGTAISLMDIKDLQGTPEKPKPAGAGA